MSGHKDLIVVEDVLPRRFEDALIDAASQSWQDRQLKVPVLQNHRPEGSQHHVLRSGLTVACAIQPQIGNTVLSVKTLAQVRFERMRMIVSRTTTSSWR